MKNAPSRACLIGFTCFALISAMLVESRSESELVRAAKAFLATLDEPALEAAQLPLDDPALLDWHFIPRQRCGLALGAMTAEQARAARALFDAALSERGLQKVDGAIALEGVLRALESTPERPATHRDPGAYHVTLFGTPSDSESWSWRLEGHHLSFNMHLEQGRSLTTPFFIGANPRVVAQVEHRGLALIEGEDALARQLYESLDEKQRAQARFPGDAPRDVLVGPGSAALPEPVPGLASADMTAEQRAGLHAIVERWVSHLAPALAKRELARLRQDEFAGLRFCWTGSTQPSQQHGWWVIGRDLLLEWTTVAGEPHHAHAQWRGLVRDLDRALVDEGR